MPLKPVNIQISSQGVGQGNPIALEPKGNLKLQKGQIEPLPPGNHGFASIQNQHLAEKLRFNSAGKDNTPKTAVEKTNHIHKLAFETGRTDELPSLQKFWDGFKQNVKVSAVGRFVQRNILHHVANTKINSLDVKATASQDRKTTLRFELKAQPPTSDNVQRKEEAEPQGHEIEVTFDRLRNQRSWFNPKRWIGNDHRTGKVVDILAKLQVDVSRQVRLRNLGIGLDQEKAFAKENSGLLSALPETAPKKGVKPPNASDYSKSELQNLKTAAKELGKEADWGPLLDKAIASGAPKAAKFSKNELAQLRKIALTVEVEKLQAIRQVCGDYAFTNRQINDLDKLENLLKGENSADLDAAIPSLATSLREMSIMAWSSMSPVSGKDGDSYNLNLVRLLAGKEQKILPLGVLMAPCFMSPQALRTQAKNLEEYASRFEKRENQLEKLEALEEQFQAAGHGSKESQKKVEDLQARATELKQSFLKAAEDCRSIAESSAGMYRFQGMLPILAGANGEELTSFLQQNLVGGFQQTTGLQPANRGAQAAVVAAGGALTVAAAFKGNVAGAAVAGAASYAAFNYLNHDGNKYSGRFQDLSNAILNGIASGSEEQLIQANRLIAEEKCEQQVQKWASAQHKEIAEHSKEVGKQEDISKCKTSLSDLAANNKLNRSAETEKIRGILVKKIQDLGNRDEGIQKTNESINKGPEATVKIHSGLSVDQVKAQEVIQKKLVSAAKSVDSECKALKGSFEILQSAYQSEGKESGRYFKQITGVEDSIASSIKDWKKEGYSGIDQGLAAIRSALATDAPKLTNDHATHLHDLTGHLEKAVTQAKELKATMLDVAKGLASPSVDYMSGSLDRNVFQKGARFVKDGQFAGDMRKLETASAAVGEGGTNPYALFRDKESREAISKPLGELLKDAKKSQESWEKCMTHSSAMVDAAQNKGDIYLLRSALKESAEQLDVESRDLQQISDKYKDLQPQGAEFDFATNIKNLHATSLRTGTARLIGLNEVPPPDSCRAALDLLSGPLADPDLHKSVAKYLEKQGNKAEALQSLFSGLPAIEKSPADWTTSDTDIWKAKLTDKSAGLEILGTLFDYAKGDADLDSAIKTATMISSGDTQKSIIAELYSAPIQGFLNQASKNKNLETIFPSEFKSGDLNPLFQKLAGKVDTLVEYGLDNSLKEKAKSVGELFKNFSAEDGRTNLTDSDFETLLKFSKVLANLQATPAATRQHQVRLAALNLLSNVDKSFKQLENPSQADQGKLRAAFTPKPKNLEEWEKFAASYKTTYKEYEKLDKFINATEQTKAGHKKDFELLSGAQNLLDTTDKDILERRDNLLSANQLYSSGEAMAKFKASGKLADKEVVLTRNQAAKELRNSEINFELLKWTNVDSCQEDKKLKELDAKIRTEFSEASIPIQWRSDQLGIHNEIRREFSPVVKEWLVNYGKRPGDEAPLETVSRMFAKGGDQIHKRLNALRGYLQSESLLKEHSPKLEIAKAAVEKSVLERDKLLGDHQVIVFKNAVRAAILTHCVDRGIDPASLAKDPHEAEIKNLLGNYGWSDKSYPTGVDIQTYFSEAKHEGFLKKWTADAGTMRSDLSMIEDKIENALVTLKHSLDALSAEIVEATNKHARGMRDEGKALSREGSALLASAKAHSDNLVGDGKLIHAKSLAVNPLRELCQRLVDSHPDKREEIQKWELDTINKIDASAEWESISSAVSSGLGDLHDKLLDCKPKSRPPYFESLVASRALEFDRAAIQGIRQVHDETAGKVETEVSKIGNLRMQLGLLSVQDALPEQIVADSDGKPRTWVKNFFNKNQDAIRSDEKFGNSQDAKALAAHFNKMQPLDFLKLFKNGGDLHNFFSDGAGKKSKEFANLISHMGKLREGFEGMDDKLSSYEGNSFRDFLDSTKFSPLTGSVKGNDDLRSIGNILTDHKLPDGVKNFQTLVGNTKINIKSEQQYKQTVDQLEADLLQKKEVQDREDLESVLADADDFDLSEEDRANMAAGVNFDLETQENPPQASARNSGQDGLMQFAMQDSFSNRRSQQIEQLAQNLPPVGSDAISIQQEAGKTNELENKKWSDNLKALGPKLTVQDYLKTQGFEFTKTDGDGDCFYNSIRHTTGEDGVLETRQLIHEGVGNFLSTIPQDDLVLHTDLKTRYQGGYIMQNARGATDTNAYGEMSECPAVARLYNRPVVVLNRTQASSDEIALDRRPIIYYPNAQPGDMTADMKIPKDAIVLVHSGGLHWDGAIPTK